jgi:hypothetical protein
VSCETCLIGGTTHVLAAAEAFAKTHVEAKGGHKVTITSLERVVEVVADVTLWAGQTDMMKREAR